MSTWTVGAARDLPLSSSDSWDGAAAKASVFSWAGWPDNPSPAKAKRAFLLYDSDAGDLKGSFKLPFATVSDGSLTAVPGGLRAAASRLPQTDAPQAALDRARSVLDGYFKRMEKGMTVENKALPLHLCELKTAGADGPHTLEGWASVFMGQPDTYGDLIVKGAFADSLKQRTPKFLWQHDLSTPIGKAISLEETDYGLFGKWQLANTRAATDAYELMKEGLTDGLSIGFITKDAEYDADGYRLLRKVDLLEISAVTIGANERALISAVKTSIPFAQLLEQAGDVFARVVREAQALRDRRATTSRPLNDQHKQAIADFLAEARALTEELDALAVVTPEAKADESEEIRLRLEFARRRYAAILREAG